MREMKNFVVDLLNLGGEKRAEGAVHGNDKTHKRAGAGFSKVPVT